MTITIKLNFNNHNDYWYDDNKKSDTHNIDYTIDSICTHHVGIIIQDTNDIEDVDNIDPNNEGNISRVNATNNNSNGNSYGNDNGHIASTDIGTRFCINNNVINNTVRIQ